MTVLAPPPLPSGTQTPPQTPPPARALSAPAARRWTFAEFEKLLEMDWVQPRRHQLIRGEIVDMGEQSARHHSMVAVVIEVLRAAFGPGFYVRNAGPMRFDDSQPEPDASVVLGGPRDHLAEHPATALLAVEVSQTTLNYDLTTKAELYATANIAEYWVIDLDGRELHVFRDPQTNAALNVTTYRAHTTHAANQSVSPLAAPNASISVADLLP
jgi:Uma2 family endonuclease